MIARGEPGFGVNHEDDDIGLVDRTLRLLAGLAGRSRLTTRSSELDLVGVLEAAGVDDREFDAAPIGVP